MLLSIHRKRINYSTRLPLVQHVSLSEVSGMRNPIAHLSVLESAKFSHGMSLSVDAAAVDEKEEPVAIKQGRDSANLNTI
jgi:hypothetical protein